MSVALLILAALFYNTIVSFEAIEECTTPVGDRGQCIAITKCPPLYNMILHANTEQTESLRKAQCGHEGQMPKVCCGYSTSVGRQTCFTPDNQIGECKEIKTCQHILRMLSETPLRGQTLDFIKNSACDGVGDYNVCCADTGQVKEMYPGQCSSTIMIPDRNTTCCGQESSSRDKIKGGNATLIDQFPWLALIEYGKTKEIRCGGVLVSGRYVLTAGHCVVGNNVRYDAPVNVRLGEYDTTNEGEDCVPDAGGSYDCTDGAISIPISRIIAHPDYVPDERTKRNDIALVRMKSLAPYSDFIRPICLPSSDVTLNPPEEFRIYAAGWGEIEEGQQSPVKMHIDLPYKTIEECQEAYLIPRRRIDLWPHQMCAGGERGRDTCKGDSGGPLMYENMRSFEVLGVVSFGANLCGKVDVPGIYTKVHSYVDWITNNAVAAL